MDVLFYAPDGVGDDIRKTVSGLFPAWKCIGQWEH
ncbi:hypothetical protein GeomeDRAFT_1819 [Geobacter metallireducens RCH3]|nr:hypothetical protein GeomeDRAFT_1819 [Geobacter metallireducens RCH3]